MNNELGPYIAKHLADSKYDLIDGFAESDISQVESGGVVDGLDAKEDEAS